MIILVGFLLAGCSGGGTPTPLLPGELAGMSMTKRVEGEKAATLIARLHAKSVAPVLSEIAYYGASEPPCTVYVSRFASAGDAENQVELMVERIGSESSGFTHPTREVRGEIEVHLVFGHGQYHAYFAAENLVYWVAASRDKLGEALGGLLTDRKK